MLYREFKNFRALNLQTFELYNVDSKYKRTKTRNLEEPLIAVAFINHEMGLNLLVVGDRYEDDIRDKVLIGNEDNFSSIDFRLRKDALESVQMLEQEFYEDIELIKTRTISKIDCFRHADYPDDLEVLIPLDDGRVEQVWVRLKKMLDGETYVGSLLHDALEVTELKQGMLVKLKYHVQPKLKAVILDSVYEETD